MRALLTGGAGFAGSYIAEEIAAKTDWQITILDCLTYAGHLDNLAQIPLDRLRFVYHDFRHPLSPSFLEYLGHFDYIIHNGAETHVATSFRDPELFVQSNVIGTLNMLEAARVLKPQVFLYVSTDEVFGQPHDHAFVETDALCPSNAYSASKAAGEMLVKAYTKTFGVPAMITRTMNMFGKRQHSEKFVPMTIQKIAHKKYVEIHTDAQGNIGSRQWIHASDQAAALLFLLLHGEIGQEYHIAGERQTNLGIALHIAAQMDKMLGWKKVNAYLQYPGHDLHYALNDDKIRSLGWSPRLTFKEGLALTI